jgi:branched-chain amino acid transport system substrate-binding protein
MHRRTLIKSMGLGSLGAAAGLAMPYVARAEDTPGVTATEIRIGHTIPYSGPASAYGVIGHSHTAFFKRVNDQGGIAGRKIKFISYDDGYSPPKTVEMVRRLVEQDKVAFLFNTLGTPTNTAIHKYVNQKKVPHLFLATGADKWADPKHYPWTIGWQPSYRTEAQIYGKYILEQKPNAKIAILYQNDDFGRDYVVGLKDALGTNYAKHVVKEASYEVTDATIDSQAVSMRDAGADVLIAAPTPKFGAQIIRKVYDMGWKPMFFMSNVSISVGAVMEPAGVEKGVGIISTLYLKDQADPAWKDDAGMNEWRAFMKEYMPSADLLDGGYVSAYGVAQTMLQVLKQCGNDFSRENIMHQATNLKNFVAATVLTGILINSSPTNYRPIRQRQLAKWDGKSWRRFGSIVSGADV